MTVLGKTKAPNKAPRCEATNSRGLRCQFKAVQFVGGGGWRCRHHSKGGA